MRVRCDKGVVLRPGVKMAFGTAEQAAEKLDIAVDFGWRSGLPLR
jgi:hypothetical protein